MKRLRSALVSGVAVALLGSACAGADTATIEQDLEAQAQAQGDLRERISTLETTLNALSGESGSGQQELRTVTQRLTDLEEALDAISILLSEEKAARETADAEAEDERGNLANRIAALESTVSALQAEIQRLENEISALRARLDSHENGHP
ncbi:MAG: hypothetical protein R3249_03080 [Nitriliruptorales bacterium]|nr:hypothetical protein [Nitriliruptorales bacterium]